MADQERNSQSNEQTKEKPTTPSGDALDDTGQDNQRKKEDNGAEADHG